ncbi:MAG: DUF4340 domain-containing protein [Gammaproteobacteria bacterium]
MNARLALNLGLIGLVGILVLLAVYEPGLDAPKKRPRLTAIEGPAVNAITVTRKDGETIVLAKEGGRWMMRAPYSVPANPGPIQSILGFLEGTSQASFPAEGHELKRFGLAEPKVRMEVDGDGFAFGDTSTMNGQRYVLYKGEVHLTMDALYGPLLAHPGDFVSPRLVEEGRELTAIQLPGATVEHRGSGWVLRPEDASVADEALARLADDWLSAQALAVRKRRDAASQDTITLELKDAPPLRFEVLVREPQLVLAPPGRGLEYRLGSGMAERLLRPARTEKKDPSAGQEASGDMAQDPPPSEPAAEP